MGLDLSYPYLVDQARSRLELDKLDAWQDGVGADGDEIPDEGHKNMRVPRQPHSFHVARVKNDNGKGGIDDLPLWSVE